MAKKKKKKWPYKYVRPEQVEDLNKESNDELLLKAHKQQKEVAAYEKQKKDDTTLKDLRAQIKEHKEGHEHRARISELLEEKKMLEAEINEEIIEVIEDKKALEGGHRDSIKSSKEMLKIITTILSNRQV